MANVTITYVRSYTARVHQTWTATVPEYLIEQHEVAWR